MRLDKRILIVTTSNEVGGAETQIARLSKSLEARNNRITVASLKPSRRTQVADVYQGLKIVQLNFSNKARLFQDVTRLIRESKNHDVILSFMYHANIVERFLKIFSVGVIHVTSIRNEKFGGRGREYAIRFTDALTDVTVVNSNLASKQLESRGVVSKKRVRTIPNGLELEKYAPDPNVRARLRVELEVSDDTFLWLAAGRLEPQKDYSTLLQATARLSAASTNFRLAVAGQGPLLDELQAKLAELGLSAHVEFLGLRRDMPALLQAADGFVLSSQWEGLPNVVMEALASGTPVVATQVGGVAELVEHGRSGWLVPAKKPEALADAMRQLMALPAEERLAMGAAGREHISQNYGLERVVDQWEALFTELLEQKRKKRKLP